MRAGFCSVCQANVWLTPQDACVHGHGAENISGIYEPVQPIPQPAVADPAVPVAVAPQAAPAEHSHGADETAGTQHDDRASGRITRIKGESGYIDTASLPSGQVYFKVSYFRGSTPPEVGDEVSFELKHYDDGRKPRAHRIARLGEEYDELMRPTRKREAPTSEHLVDWAYLGYMPRVLRELEKLALDERWEFVDSPANPERPLPILHHYLLHTFGRLFLEQKVVVTEDCQMAAFNTGLVDARYESIYALFSPNEHDIPWKLDGFCIPGDGFLGQTLSRNFNPLPQPAHYFSKPAELFYDTGAGSPDIDWNHVVIDRLSRYPTEFLEDHWPAGIDMLDSSTMSEEEAEAYWVRVGEAVKADDQLYRRIMNRVKDAIALSTKRTASNFRTAVPNYYPKIKQMTLLLPICLVSDEITDMALALEKTPSGKYLGHTMLPLDWAYLNARLVCRPGSDWLDARMIAHGRDEEDAPGSTSTL